MSFRPITKEEALAIHSAVVARFGGIDGVRDEGLLESALAQPFQSFAGIELYPTDEAKACRYLTASSKTIHSPMVTNEPPPPSWVHTSGYPGSNSSRPTPSFLKPCLAPPIARWASSRWWSGRKLLGAKRTR